MTNRRLYTALLLTACLGGLTSMANTARADGLLIGPGELAVQSRTSLQSAIQQARATHPQAFDQVADLRTRLPELDAQKRGPYPVITPALAAFGADALMPMIERLAFDTPGRGALTGSAWLAWRAGLVEVVGKLRDPRAEPVLRAILDSSHDDYLIVQAAAAAYGKLGTDAVAAKLVSMSHVVDSKQLGVVSGMGHCRRLVVAERLAEILEAIPDDPSTKVVARALAAVAGAWVWQAPTATHVHEAAAIRYRAAEVLIGVFVDYDEPVQRQLTKAVLVVDHADTLAFIAAAKSGRSAADVASLDKLAQRYKNSPFRRRSTP